MESQRVLFLTVNLAVLLLNIDAISEPDCSELITEKWTSIQGFKIEFYVTAQEMNLTECKNTCDDIDVRQSSSLAWISTFMLTREFRRILCLGDTSLWATKLRGNPALSYVMKWPGISVVNDTETGRHCLCQRVLTPTTPSTTTDALSESDCSELITEEWTSIQRFKIEFYVTAQETNLTECKNTCDDIDVRQSSSLAWISTFMLTREFRRILCLGDTSLWANKLRGNPSLSYVMKWPGISEVNDTETGHHCLCQRKLTPTTPSTTTEKQLPNLVNEINTGNFVIVYKTLTFKEAMQYCLIKFKSTVMFYENLIRYFDVADTLSLNLGSYWIHDKDKPSNSCFYMKKHQGIFVGQGACDVKHYVICAPSVNMSLILLEQNYIEMIKNMTVSYRNTTKWLNTLTCADDKRQSARIVGSTGLVILVVLLSSFIISDVQRVLITLYRFCTLDHDRDV